jgi:hypothetical protein
MAYKHNYPWQIITRTAGLELVYAFEQRYDAARLQQELAAILQEYAIVPHYRPYLTNGWGAITLYGPNGDPNDPRPWQAFQGKDVAFTKTPVLRLAPYMESVLDGLAFPKRRVRLMQLTAGKRIYWHHDSDEYGFDARTVRLHVPVVTNDRVEFQVSHHDCRWQPGELWYLDNSFPHRLYNGGSEGRVHLVIDLEVNNAVKAMFPDRLHEQRAVRDACRKRCRAWHDRTVGRVMKVRRKFNPSRKPEHAMAG